MDVVVPQTGIETSVYTTQKKDFATAVALTHPENIQLLKFSKHFTNKRYHTEKLF